MRLLASGVSHKTAPIEVRERLALHPQRQADVLRGLVAHPDCQEALVLSTCNRFELFVTESVCRTGLVIGDLIEQATGVPHEEAKPHLYTHEGLAAAKHLFEVACGADSMVLGESEIMGQVKAAADVARGAGTLGTVLSRLTDTALATGKRVRSGTRIDQGCASVASVGVSLARQICGDPGKTTALLIGAGETAELTLNRLIDCGTDRVYIANRTASRARRLADKCGGVVTDFDAIYEVMVEADVVIASTSAPHAVVRAEPMRQVVRERHARPLFLIDLAVPRDVEPGVERLDNVFLYNIDSLQEAVTEALADRERELPAVRAICADAATEFWGWAASLDLLPTMLELRGKAEAVREQELEKALRNMGELSPKQRKHMHLLTKRIVQGLINDPLNRLRTKACDGNGIAYLEVLRELFDLTDQPEGQRPDEASVPDTETQEGSA